MNTYVSNFVDIIDKGMDTYKNRWSDHVDGMAKIVYGQHELYGEK
jgi:hypothetical protein